MPTLPTPVTTEPSHPSPPLSAYGLSTTYRTATRNMKTSGYKLMALAAMVAGATCNGQSLFTGPAPPRQMTRGPPATEEDAEPAVGERGVQDETCALSGDTMSALIAMCRERKWVLAVDHAGKCLGDEGTGRFVLTMGARADGSGDGGHKGDEGLETCRCACATRALTAATTMLVCSLSQCHRPIYLGIYACHPTATTTTATTRPPRAAARCRSRCCTSPLHPPLLSPWRHLRRPLVAASVPPPLRGRSDRVLHRPWR